MITPRHIGTIALVPCLLAGCATSDGSAPPDPTFLAPRPDRATLIVTRPPELVDDGCAYRIAIDAQEVGALVPGGWITLYPPAGAHVVALQASGPTCPARAEVRPRLEANRHLRLQIVRTSSGALQWKADDTESRTP